MITPNFSIKQDETFLTVEIQAPHVRAQDIELYVDGQEFKFHLAPYFLRLNLPGRVVEDDRATSSYDIATGTIICRVAKETLGEHFEDLDMLTKLLARRGEEGGPPKVKPLIEVLDEDEGEDDGSVKDAPAEKDPLADKEKYGAFAQAMEFDWQEPQQLPDPGLLSSLTGVKYGFNNAYSGYFLHWMEKAGNEVCEIPDPETTPREERRTLRMEMEDGKFSQDHYIGDLVSEEDFAYIRQYKTSWWNDLRIIQKEAGSDGVSIVGSTLLTPKEREDMLKLPRKEFLLEEEKSIYLGLVDLLFAFSYDHRIMEGDTSVESAWTMAKLSATMAAFETYNTLPEVVMACTRRALAFPLYRHWGLIELVLRDVYILLKLGRVACLKALLAMRDTLDHHDVYYVYSRIWLDDYCVWIQGASEKQLKSLASELHHFALPKSSVGWSLPELEVVAKEAKEEDMEMGE